MRILVCAETRRDKVLPVSRELLTAARSLLGSESGTVEVLLAARDAAAAAAGLGGADTVLAASNVAFEIPTAEAYSTILAAVISERRPDIILCAYTALGLDIAPNLAARTEMPLVAYVTGLQRTGHSVSALSQVYGGKFIARTETPLPAIFVINPGVFGEMTAEGGQAAEVVSVPSSALLADPRVTFVSETLPDSNAVDLAKAERIVCVGRGIGDKDSIEAAQDLADALGAEIAGSRPVVDGGWLPKERQVGKSGIKVKPKLYVALGVSGAPEHLEGMSNAELIIAVNSDPAAPIFNVAHYGATCDLFDLLPALTERLNA